MSTESDPKRWRDDPDAAASWLLLSQTERAAPPVTQARVLNRLRARGSKRSRPGVGALAAAAAAAAGAVGLAVWWMSSAPAPAPRPEIASESTSGSTSGSAAEVEPRSESAPESSTTSVAHCQSAAGEVQLRGEQGLEALRPRTPLTAGTEIRVGSGGHTLLGGLTGVQVAVSENTELILGTMDAGRALELRRGAVLVAVAPGARVEPVRVIAGAHTVEVVGTLFAVQRREPTAIAVQVFEGTVRLRGEAGEREIPAGRSFEQPQGILTTIPETAFAALGRPDLAPPAPSAEEVPRPSASAESTGGIIQGHSRRTTSEKRSEERRGADEVELYRRAEEATNPATAISLFDRVAQLGGSYAAVARYRAAQRTAQHDVEDAAQRFEVLAALGDGSPFAVEARIWLVDLYMESSELEHASTHIDTMLAQHPGGERAPELRFFRAEIARAARGDCQAAILDYQASRASARHAEESLYWLAWCEGEIGDEAAAVQHLRRYLDRFPSGRFSEAARAALAGQGQE